MTPLVWAYFLLALLFIGAFVGIPLWLTCKWPDAPPDHSHAHAHLAAKAARAGQEAPFVLGQPMVPQVAASPVMTAAMKWEEARR